MTIQLVGFELVRVFAWSTCDLSVVLFYSCSHTRRWIWWRVQRSVERRKWFHGCGDQDSQGLQLHRSIGELTPPPLPFPSPPQFLLSPSPCTWPTHCISLAMYRCWVANVPRKRKIRNFQANVSAHVDLCFACSICSKDRLRRTAPTSCSKLRSWVSSITWMLSDWRAWSPNVSMSDRPHLFVSTCAISCHPIFKVKACIEIKSLPYLTLYMSHATIVLLAPCIATASINHTSWQNY